MQTGALGQAMSDNWQSSMIVSFDLCSAKSGSNHDVRGMQRENDYSLDRCGEIANCICNE